MTGLSNYLIDELEIKDTLNPAAFDTFSKGISAFAKALKPKTIQIHRSRLMATADYGRTIYEIDFSGVFPSERTMAFVNRKEDIKALQEMQGNSPIVLLKMSLCIT